MERDQPEHPRSDRRSFLTGAAASLGLALTPGVVVGSGSFGPRASLGLRGTKEVVVDGSGTVAYAATSDGMATVDLSDPADPAVLAERRELMADHDRGPLRQVFDASVSGDRLAVGGPAQAAGSLYGFVLFDVSDPANPEQVAFHRTGYPLHNLYLEDGVVYLTANAVRGKPVTMVDVSNDDPQRVGSFSPTDYDRVPSIVHDVYVSGDRLYACYWDLGTWVVDVSDPAAPAALLWVGSDMDTDTGTTGFELPGNSHYAQPHPERDVLAVGKEAFENDRTEADGAPGGIELWDLSDASNPTRETIIAPPSATETTELRTAHNFGWKGDRLYAGWYTGGVAVYEVADASDPKRLAGWKAPERASFWTAKPVADGFLGASMEGSAGAGVYTFPEPSGEAAEPARTMDPLAPALSETYADTPTPTPTDTPTPTGTPTDTPTVTRQATGTTAGEAAGTDTREAAPGFGALATLAAGGVAAYRLLRRRNEG